MFDVVVIGAGPAGSTAARCCAENGLKTLLIEEHATIGHPVQCAGLLSMPAFRECCVTDHPVIHHVRGARIVPLKGECLEFDAGEPKAVVVDRLLLDREMGMNAARAGAEIRLKTAVTGIEGTTLITRGIFGSERIRFRCLVAADGARSGIARFLGMRRSPAYVAGIQAEIPHAMDDRFVEVHPHASPDFFGWLIPIGGNRVRIGLCSQDDVNSRFNTFIGPFGAENVHLVTGTIPIGVMPRTYGHRTLFVGDAAGMAKPTSGGGIYTGVRSAKYASEVAAFCCEQNSFDDHDLKAYERLWMGDFGMELKIGYHLFRIRQRIDPAIIDECIGACRDPDVLSSILTYGDMDRPGILLRQLIRKPSLLRLIGRSFRLELEKCMNS